MVRSGGGGGVRDSPVVESTRCAGWFTRRVDLALVSVPFLAVYYQSRDWCIVLVNDVEEATLTIIFIIGGVLTGLNSGIVVIFWS